MTMQRWFRSAAAIGAIAALTLTGGCTKLEDEGTTADPSASATQGGELTFAGFIGSPKSWNPLTAQGDTTGNRQTQWPFYPHVFYAQSDGSLQVNTDLMESVELVGEDPMTVEYRIRPDAVWSDGEPIDGDDFAFTQAVQDPRQCAECTPAWTSGYDQMTLSVSEDKLTVTAVFDQPFSAWQTLFITLLPAHVAEGYGDMATAFNEGMVQNVPTVSGGPYMIADFAKDVSMTLTRNERWYGEPANLDTIHFRFITNPSEVITAYQNGEVDLIYENPTLETVQKANQIEGSSVEIRSSLTYYHLIFKSAGDALGDETLRLAVARAIDAEDIVTRVPRQYDAETPVLRSLAYAPGQAVSGTDADPYRENTEAANVGYGDVDGARQLLEDNGYTIEDGALIQPDGTPLRSLSILTYQSDNERMQIAQIVQSQLKELGITCTIDAADNTRYGTAGFAGEFDIEVTGTAADLGVQALDQWYGTGKARNGSGYSNADFDRLVEEGNLELDPDRQIEILNEMDVNLLEHAVALPLYSVGNMMIHQSNFTGAEPSMSKYGITWSIDQWGYVS